MVMNTQFTALRLADILEHRIPSIKCLEVAATELRRLHEVNQELVKALKRLIGTGLHEFEYNRIMSDRSHYVNAVLAKAKENT
jgi:hypothetical protein